MAEEFFNSLLVQNIPGMHSPKYDPNSLYGRMFLIAGLPRKTPTILYTGNHYIERLKDFKHNFFDVDYLNQKGLHIFLLEPMCYYRSDGEGYDQGFYYEFSDNKLDENYRAYELDSILEYVQKNKLTDVTIHTCDYQADAYLKYYTPYMKIMCDDLFLKMHVVFDNVLKNKPPIDRKFLCLNWRYTKARHLMMLYLMDKPGYYSWYFDISYRNFQKNLWFNVREKLVNTHPEVYNTIAYNVEKLNSQAPLILDVLKESEKTVNETGNGNVWPDDVKDVPTDNRLATSIQQYYFKSFAVIVTETRFAQPTGNFSEKTFYAMKYRKPFVLVAPPYTLRYLREEGFKTFSDFWDESYDEIEDHTQRLLAIYKVIDFINQKSMEELYEIYSKMIPIIDHNYTTLVNYTFDKSLQGIPKK